MEEQLLLFWENDDRLAPVHDNLHRIALSGHALRGWPRLGRVPAAPLASMEGDFPGPPRERMNHYSEAQSSGPAALPAMT